MQHKLVLFAVLLLNCQLNAQVVLRGTLANLPANSPRELTLEFWNIERWQQTKAFELKPDNSFVVPLATATPGQYRLRLSSLAKRWNDFIIADSLMADTALVFSLDFNTMDGGPARVNGSAANALYFDLITAQRRYNGLRDSSQVTPVQLEAVLAENNRRFLKIARQYDKSLVGDVAWMLYEPVKADFPGNAAVEKMTANEFARAYDLSKVPFHHENALHHTAFYRHINRYFNYFEQNETGCKAYVDGIMARRNGNEAVDGYVFRHILDKLIDYKQDAALTYLLTWFAPDCTDENPLPRNTRFLLEALKTCTPGNIAPDLTLQNLAGQKSVLSETCAKNKLTLMLFWRTTCTHCMEFEPKLEKIYAKYHPLGVEVFALSSDSEEGEWRKHLEAHPTPWVNVLIPNDRRNEIDRMFPSPSTPTLIALDKDRRVVSRVLSRINLEAYLDEQLEKRKN